MMTWTAEYGGSARQISMNCWQSISRPSSSTSGAKGVAEPDGRTVTVDAGAAGPDKKKECGKKEHAPLKVKMFNGTTDPDEHIIHYEYWTDGEVE